MVINMDTNEGFESTRRAIELCKSGALKDLPPHVMERIKEYKDLLEAHILFNIIYR